jgi:dTMP kinase
VIAPAMAAGRWIVCDRFTDSTYAYQCGGRGLDAGLVARLEEIVHPGLQPDATSSSMSIPPPRRRGRTGEGARTDKFERERADFHVRVRGAYLERARRFPGRIHVITPPERSGKWADASGPRSRGHSP